MSRPVRGMRALTLLLLVLAPADFLAVAQAAAPTGDAQWIWSPAQKKDAVPEGTCYFRKLVILNQPVEEASIHIACDDHYQLYVNGRAVGSGKEWRTFDEFDITKFLIRGRNVIGVAATNESPGAAGLVASVLVKPVGGTHVSYSTDRSWMTRLNVSDRWNMPTYHARGWIKAQSFGKFGETLPWGNETQVAAEKGRFRTPSNFDVEWVLEPKRTGSLIAMTFDELGNMVLSQEGGPLLLASDRNGDGIHETVATFCDKIKNCQGMLAINGSLLAVGDGPEGAALYRITDKDRDGSAEKIETVFKFKGGIGEHGPHAVTLGPDGMIYILVGNHASVDLPIEDASPHHDFYEGDLVQPRHEDPGGHANGTKTPGGVVYRTDFDGTFVEQYAGGLRNPYDIAFNPQGDLFTYDADMEWDHGLPWYRPTRVNHVTPGAEFGWRSGWAKWPEYYLDSLPSTINLGGGSPTGVTFYDHFMYPVRFQGAMFGCDWSRGRINMITMKKKGGTYEAKSSVFVEGRPLNVTDIAVGPDGLLYFCTGGRGTEGGIYRVVWDGKVPPAVKDLGIGIQRALRQPQIHSSWARQRLAETQRKMGASWGTELYRVAQNKKERAAVRNRALDLTQLFGPTMSPELCVALSRDSDPLVRAKVAYLAGVQSDEKTARALTKLLTDTDATVRRKAIESLTRRGEIPPFSQIEPLLKDDDRFVSFAARRALERASVNTWRDRVLESNQTRVFLQGATALMIAEPSRENALRVVARCEEFLEGKVQDPAFPAKFINDRNFLDLTRVAQLALIRGELDFEDAPQLRQLIANEYPSKNAQMNRELIRLIAFFEDQSVAPRAVQQMRSEIPWSEKFFLAAHMPHFAAGLATDERLEMLKFYEQTRTREGGDSTAGYVDKISRKFFSHLTEQERLLVLADGERWPSSSLAVLATLPKEPSSETMTMVRRLDRKVVPLKGDAADRLRVGVVAILARSGDADSMAYLRELFRENPDRRAPVTVGLAQDPGGENWPLLVESLPILEGRMSRMVLNQLMTVDRKPTEPQAIRQLILVGLRNPNAADAVDSLLTHWTGEQLEANSTADAPMAHWQTWFEEKHESLPPAQLPVDSTKSRWTFAELHSFLGEQQGQQGDAGRGALVFKKAQCSKCHRFESVGDRTGPDLTNVSRRFRRKEILESILFPSQVISDQYQAQKIQTSSGQLLVGIVIPAGADRVVVQQLDGEKVEIAKSEIEDQAPSRHSAMPEGLLNELTLEEIADLFAYLNSPGQSKLTSRPEGAKR